MTAILITLVVLGYFFVWTLCVMAKRGDRAFEDRP